MTIKTSDWFCFSIVLTHSKRYSFFMPILPCLVAFCQAFPPLYEDVAALLLQVGQVCASDVSTKSRDNDPLLARKYSQPLWQQKQSVDLTFWTM